MKVLISGHLPPPVGGIAVFYQSLLNSSLPTRIEHNFVITSSQRRELSASGRATFANLISAMQDCFRFIKALISFRPRVVHIATAFGLSFVKHSICVVAARLAGCRVLLHPHCGYSRLYEEQPAWWQWFVRRVMGLTHGLIVLSQEWDQVKTVLPGQKVYFLPNAIDLKPYNRIAEERFEEGIKGSGYRVLYLGYLGKAKGTYDLIDAAKMVNEVNQNIAFDLVGPELAEGEISSLQNAIQAHQLTTHVFLHPPAYGQEKMTILRDSDLFAYPSYHEGMPMAIIEAMGSGLALVASEVGGIPDMVENGENGLLIPAGRPDLIARAILDILSERERLQTMQKRSWQIAVEKFDIEKLVDRLIEIYTLTDQ